MITNIPKSKSSAKAQIASQYYIKNVIETIHIDSTYVEINCIYDTIHKGNRYSAKAESASHYSCTINHKNGTVTCGGYGENDQITHPTYESILNYILKNLNVNLELIRDFKLKLLLE